MINVTDATKTEYQKDSVAKNVLITFPNAGITYTNNDLKLESVQLHESINTDANLTFKGCISSMFKFTCAMVSQDLRGQYVEATIQAGQTEIIPLFKGYVDKQTNITQEDALTEFICYDLLYNLQNVDIFDWYHAITFPITVKAFRDSLFQHLNILQEVTVLVNDESQLTDTIKTETLNALDMLKWICQANGRFGRIGRDGIFHYIKLDSTAQGVDIAMSDYKTASYEPYEVQAITALKIVNSEGSITTAGSDFSNTLYIVDNPIAYALQEGAAENILSEIEGLGYISAEVDCRGLPYIEPGDVITATTKLNTIRTYVLNRHLRGIHRLFDTYTGSGDELQAQYKENAESRNLAKERHDRLQSEDGIITALDVESGRITAEVSRAVSAELQLSNIITQTADSLQVQISELYSEIDGDITLYYVQETPTLLNYPAWDFTYNIPVNDTVQLRDDLMFEYTEDSYRKNLRSVAYDETNNLTYRFIKANGVWYWDEVANTETSMILSRLSTLEATAEGIQTEVSEIEVNIGENYYTKTESNTKFTQTAELISVEASRAQTAESELSSRITVNANGITTLNTKTGVNSLGQSETLYSKISANASAISSEVTRATEAEGVLSSNITQTASDLSAEITNRTNAESVLSSSISANASAITAEVSRATTAENGKYSIQSGIAITANGVEISGSKYIKIKSGGTFSVDSGNFSISNTGAVSIKGTVTTANITATGGYIGPFIINDNGFTYNDLGHTYNVLRNTSELIWSLGDNNVVMNVRGNSVNITATGNVNIGTSATQTVKLKNMTATWKNARDAVSDNDYVLVGDA